MQTLPTIHRDHFEAWLFSQPDGRQFDYGDCRHCVGASFVKEIHGHTTLWGPWDYLHEGELVGQLIPEWLYDLLHAAKDNAGRRGRRVWLSVPVLKASWQKLFPESPLPQPTPTAEMEAV